MQDSHKYEIEKQVIPALQSSLEWLFSEEASHSKDDVPTIPNFNSIYQAKLSFFF